MKILITGAAGYVGSHVSKSLLKKGYFVIGTDNFAKGEIVPVEILRKKSANYEFIKADLLDKEAIEKVFREKNIDLVIHLATKANTAKTANNRDEYFKVNYDGGINLIEAMANNGVKNLIYSSTAAVYGDPIYTPIDESHPACPKDPYGESKLEFEKYLTKVLGINYITFRFFNVSGADGEGILGRASADPIGRAILAAIGKGDVSIMGDKYDTADGTVVRDFVHIDDICEAIFKASGKVAKLNGQIINLGSGKGTSIMAAFLKVREIAGDFEIKIGPPREGDIAVSVADISKAQKLLNWRPIHSDLENIIKSDYNWRIKHPNGY